MKTFTKILAFTTIIVTPMALGQTAVDDCKLTRSPSLIIQIFQTRQATEQKIFNERCNPTAKPTDDYLVRRIADGDYRIMAADLKPSPQDDLEFNRRVELFQSARERDTRITSNRRDQLMVVEGFKNITK